MSPTKLPQVRLQHILHNIDSILDATAHLSDREIRSSYVIQKAVERAVEIISEAAKALPPTLRAEEAEIPWQDIIGIGNHLRHEYYRIQDDVMIDIIRTKLPELRPAIQRLVDAIR